jgi:molybdopterin synthase sulfur carrier subunit
LSATVRLPGALGEATGGATRIEASGATLGELVAELERRYPGLRGRVLDETGALRTHVNVFIGDEDARQAGGANAPVPDGAVVMVIPAMAGGGGSSQSGCG